MVKNKHNAIKLIASMIIILILIIITLHFVDLIIPSNVNHTTICRDDDIHVKTQKQTGKHDGLTFHGLQQ